MNRFILSILTGIVTSFIVLALLRAQANKSGETSITLCGTTLAESSYLEAYARIMSTMHAEMQGVEPGPDDRINFLRQMIPHHQGAIEMSEAILNNTNDRRIINIARGILVEQENEIKIMESLIYQLEKDSINVIQ